MKKKTIEKIPYLTLKKLSRKKDVEYIGVTALVEVAGETMLMLEVYRNAKGCKETPRVRVMVGQKDFGTFFPESEEWSRGKITKNTWSNYGLIWREDDERISKTTAVLIAENALTSEEDLERIQKFTQGHVYVHDKRKWWEYIDRFQQHILQIEYRDRSEKRWKRRQRALDDRGNNTPELPEKKILDYADNNIFHQKHLLIYKKRGARARVACTKCGGVTDARWKPGQSYESQFERIIEEPRQGSGGKCPMCGAFGVYTAQGKVQSFRRETSYLFLGQKYKETGVVFRYVEVEKEWQLELFAGEKGPEIYGACEQLSGVEIARAYFEPGKKMQMDFHKHDCFGGKDFWDDCNLSGLSNIVIHPARVMKETYDNLRGTFLQYSAIKEYQEAAGDLSFNPVDYMERYIQTPQIEMLVKMKLIGVVKMLVKYHYGIVEDVDAKRPDEFLGIRKERVKQLIGNQGDTKLLEVMQMEKRMDEHWTEEQVEALTEIGIQRDQLTLATQYMTVQQILNRVKKYARCEYGTGCSHAMARLKQIASTYFDYLGMRQSLSYDLNNTVYQQPRDLTAAHTKMVTESSKKEADKRLAEVKTRFSDIRKQYRKLRNRYFWEDENLLIRPARSAEEIVTEGRILHHCVGGDGYLGKHNRGETYILMVRQQADPEIPYITVEIDAKRDSIIQWYGAHDKKPDEKNMQRWLDSYIVRLKCGQLAAGAAQEASQQVLMMAI